jgi:hypothetical protein
MKKKININIIISTFLLFNIINIITTIGVSFLTLNLENGNLNEDELAKIVDLLNYAGNDHGPILDPEDNILEDYEDLSKAKLSNSEKLDFILISIQEANTDIENLDQIINSRLPESWICQVMLKNNGLAGGSYTSTIVQVCGKKKYGHPRYVNIKEKGFLKSLVTTKHIMGFCYTIGNADYCFMGGHLPVKVDSGAELVSQLANVISTTSEGRKFYAFLAGDINTKALYTESKDVLEVTAGDAKPTNEIDSSSVFVSSFKRYMSRQADNKITIKFVGNHQLHQLPFTYKFLGGDSLEYDIRNILKKKKLNDEKEVFSLGWLDRMLCFTNDPRKPNCSIADNLEKYFSKREMNTGKLDISVSNNIKNISPTNNGKTNYEDDFDRIVRYYLVPILKKGDHIPVLGFIEIFVDNKENVDKRRKYKKFLLK